MKSSTPTILSIAPGRKNFSVAVFTGTELAHFSVHKLQSEPARKLLKYTIPTLIRALIVAFSPQIIAVRNTSQYQKASTLLNPAIKIIEREATVSKLRFTKVSLAAVKSALCDSRRATQKKAFQNLTALYPELGQFTDRPNKWQNDYYHNLLSAVAVGFVILRSPSAPK